MSGTHAKSKRYLLSRLWDRRTDLKPEPPEKENEVYCHYTFNEDGIVVSIITCINTGDDPEKSKS